MPNVPIYLTGQGEVVLVPGTPGQRTRVLSYFLAGAGSPLVRWRSRLGGIVRELSGPMRCQKQLAWQPTQGQCFEADLGADLVLQVSGPGGVRGSCRVESAGSAGGGVSGLLAWADPGGAGQNRLAWDAANGALSYNVYRGTASGAEQLLARNVAANGYADSTAVPGVTYFYRVTATTDAGEGQLSNEASAAATAVVFTPLSLSPALWLKADAGLVTDGAAGFASASSQSLACPDSDTFTFAGSFSIQAWVKLTGMAVQFLVAKEASDATAEWSLLIGASGNPESRFWGTGGLTQALGPNISANTWAHLVTVYDAAAHTLTTYTNGVAGTPVATSGTLTNRTAPLTVGAGRSPSNADGSMDSVGLYSRALSAAEVISLYNAGAGLLYDQLPAGLTTGLVSWYDLGEQTSAQRNDRVGTNHLTQSGGVTLTTGIASGAALYDGDPVATWQDQSGNANHATQATATKRALLKLAIQNGLPVVRSDGVDDFLALASRAWFPSKRGWFAGVWKLGASGNRLLGTFGASVPFIWYTTTSGTAYKWHDAVSDLTDAANDPAAFFQQSVNRIGDTTLEVYTNGGSLNTLTLANNQPSAVTLSIAANQTGTSPAALDIGELIGGDGALSAANRVALEGYLRSRWGTP